MELYIHLFTYLVDQLASYLVVQSVISKLTNYVEYFQGKTISPLRFDFLKIMQLYIILSQYA